MLKYSFVKTTLIMAAVLMSHCKDPAKPDTILPTVSITYPANFTAISEPITIKVDATDNEGILFVDLFIDGEMAGNDTVPPYEYDWNIFDWPPQSNHVLFALATDNSGNIGRSEWVSVTAADLTINAPTLLSPVDSTVFYDPTGMVFMWDSVDTARRYEIRISRDANFSHITFSNALTDTEMAKPSLLYGWCRDDETSAGN